MPEAIGGTPVVRLERRADPGMAEVLVKLEAANPGGSYKDRMALANEGAERAGRLRPGQPVVEYTGGSTGSSLALACAVTGYRPLGRELLAQLDGRLDAFCAYVGTSGCFAGATRELRETLPGLHRVAVVPSESPVLAGGEPGTHGMEGGGSGFWPPQLGRGAFDEVLSVSTAEAFAMARRAAREEGIFSGPSTGANLLAALELARRLGPGKRVATVQLGPGLEYLAGDLDAA